METSRSSSAWQIFPGFRADANVHHAALGAPFARRPDRQAELVGPGDQVVLQLALSGADPFRRDLGDHVEPALRDEVHGRRRRPVLEPSRGRVVLEAVELEREGFGLRESSP